MFVLDLLLHVVCDTVCTHKFMRAIVAIDTLSCRMHVDKLLDGMLVSNADFGIPVHTPRSAREGRGTSTSGRGSDGVGNSGGVRRDGSAQDGKPPDSVGKQESGLPPKKPLLKSSSAKASGHAKSVSIDERAITGKDSRTVVLNGVQGIVFASQATLRALTAVCKSNDVFRSLDRDDTGCVRRSVCVTISWWLMFRMCVVASLRSVERLHLHRWLRS